MQYSIKPLISGSYTILDANGVEAIAKPCAKAVAEKLCERWNTTPETKKTAAPQRVPWSDAGTLALMRTMQTYNFVISAKRQADWRAVRDDTGVAPRGSLPSLSISTATLLATDGIVAYFVLGDDKTLLYGHLAAFVENSSGPAGDKKRSRKSPKANKVQDALNLLNDFFNTQQPQAPQ